MPDFASTDTPTLLAALVVGYLLGTIPFGLILTRLAGLGDVRNIGSGNIGATNVLRTGNKGLAAATLVFDALKGLVAVLFGAVFGPLPAAAAGLAALLGHVFPVWLRFRGGKGVATYIGVLLAIHWPAVIVFAAVWLGTAYLTRYSSAGALAATVAVPPALYLMGEPTAFWLFLILSAIIWITHRQNIRRLMAGSESRIGSKR